MSKVFSAACPICPPKEIQTVNAYYEYCGSFTLEQPARNLRFFVSAHSDYALYLDKSLIGFGQFADYAISPTYDTLALTELSAGTHEVRIVVYHVGMSTSRNRNRPTTLICQLNDLFGHVIFASSPEMTVRLHPAYHSGSYDWVSGQLGFTFAYDARKETNEVPFLPAHSAGNLPDPLPRPIEKLTVGKDMDTKLIASGHFLAGEGTVGMRVSHADLTAPAPSDGIWFRYDLGRETTGILSLDLELEADAEILIGWGEHLDKGRVHAYIGGRNFACSYYAKAGRNTFVNPFLRLGLRYLEILIFAPNATIHTCTIRETLYPLSESAAFRCDDALHNKIYDTSLRTLHLCMHEHYEDCPWREQALYSMDSRNQMLCGYYAFGETRFPRASIDLMAKSLRPDHMLELCSPAEVSITIPSFSAIFLTQLAEYYDHSGDLDFIRRMMPTAIDIADGFLRRADNELGLLPVYPDGVHWNFYEWQSGLEGAIGYVTPPEQIHYPAPLNAFVSFGLANLSRLLSLLGMEEKAKEYENAHHALNAALNSVFWQEDRGCYASFRYASDGRIEHYAELTNALILYAGAAPQDRHDRVCKLLAAEDGSLLPVTLSHSIFKYEVLLRAGGYHRYVFAHIGKVFGSMLDAGATTFWETADGSIAFGEAGSLCHGWSAIPVYLYHKYAVNATEDCGLPNCHLAPRHTFS